MTFMSAIAPTTGERWDTCGLCEQGYHGVVHCALGWACWKTYLGRPEIDMLRSMAMNMLGSSLAATGHFKDAVIVQEAQVSMWRRLGAPEDVILVVQTNLSCAQGAGHADRGFGGRRVSLNTYFSEEP